MPKGFGSTAAASPCNVYHMEGVPTMDMSRRQFLQVAGMGILSVAGMGTLAGCGSSSDGKSGSASGSSDSKLAAIKDRGKLKCGVKKDVIGYGYLDTKTKKYEGLEIDLCYQIAAAVLGVSYDEAVEKELCEFTDVTPKTRGPLIDNDQLDIIAATYTITDERKKSWDFSTPYRTDHVGILIKKKSGMTKMADLDGKIIGVSQGSTTKDLVLQMLKDQASTPRPSSRSSRTTRPSRAPWMLATSTPSPWTVPRSRVTPPTTVSSWSPRLSLAPRTTAWPPRRAATCPRPSTTPSRSSKRTAGSTRNTPSGTCSNVSSLPS